MVSSAERNAALQALGAMLSSNEAGAIAARLEADDTLSAALRALPVNRRDEVRGQLERAGLSGDRPVLALVLRAVQGARSVATKVEPLWTMPGHIAQGGPLTSRIPRLVDAARVSVTCSTYNFQSSSGLWRALHDAAQRPGVQVRVYLDTLAAQPKKGWIPPSPAEIAAHVAPGVVFQTIQSEGRLVRNHAKMLVIDHRFLVITSANFSRSAEVDNVEFGVQIDDDGLAESAERELGNAEALLYAIADPAPVSGGGPRTQ